MYKVYLLLHLIIINIYFNFFLKKDLILLSNCPNVSLSNFTISDITGSDNMTKIINSTVFLTLGELKQCSLQTSSIFYIDSSIFYIENITFFDFYSLLIYAANTFIKIDNCSFNNLDSTTQDYDFAIKFENNSSFVIANSLFENLNNFVSEVKKLLFLHILIIN